MLILVWYLVSNVLGVSCIDGDTIQISTGQGAITGKILRTHGSRIFAFQGIPYAEPPTGDRRWKLNIKSGMPVMVWLHGGGFTSGSAAEFLPMGLADNLAKRGIVVVTANYRLGALGFFATASAEAPGNLAFHDQLEVLRWVSKNIAAYGGDPEGVTLAGQGAGAISASILSLSPVANGLFKRIILQSGSALSPGAVSSEGNANASKALAALSGCSSAPELDDQFASISFQRELLSCLRNKTYRELLDLSRKVRSQGHSWAAIQDNTFLTQRPELLLKNRRPYDAIVGVTKDEWGLEALKMVSPPAGQRSINQFSKDDVASEIKKTVRKVAAPEIRGPLQNLAKAVYVDSLATEVNGAGPFWLQRLITMKSELLFAQPALREAESLATAGSLVFLYRMDYLSPNAFPPPSFQWRGAVHTSEVPYIFGAPGSWDVFEGSGFSPTTLDKEIKNTFGTLWTDFVKSGNPTNSNSLNFNWLALSVNSTTDSVSSNFLALDDRTRMQDSFCPRCTSFITSISATPSPIRISARDEASAPKRPPVLSAAVKTPSSPNHCYSETIIIAMGAVLGVTCVIILILCFVICSIKKASRKFTPPSLPGF